MGLSDLLSRLAMKNPDVSNVSPVQALDSKAFGRYGSDTANVSDVSGVNIRPAVDTADTADIFLTYQRKPLQIGACTPDTADTSQITNALHDVGFCPDLPVHRSIPKRCIDCQHFASPGKSDGYCGGRDDLPLAYGVNHPLRRLPADRGANCGQWMASE